MITFQEGKALNKLQALRCDKCIFWRLGLHNKGECRINSPRGTEAEIRYVASWPITNEHDFCGQGMFQDEEENQDAIQEAQGNHR